MTTTKNGNAILPTATATPARVQVFQASQRPVWKKGEIITSWGKCTIEGRLGQRHADLLDSFLFYAEKSRITESGELEVLVDPAKIRRSMGSQYSYSGMWVLIKELSGAVIDIKTDKMRAVGSLLASVKESEKTRSNPLDGGKRQLWRVRLGECMTFLLKNDIQLFYDPAPIARLQNGITQAIARHVISHKQSPPGGWRLDTLIDIVLGDGTEMKPENRRNRRREINADKSKLAEMGIIINDDGRVTY